MSWRKLYSIRVMPESVSALSSGTCCETGDSRCPGSSLPPDNSRRYTCASMSPLTIWFCSVSVPRFVAVS